MVKRLMSVTAFSSLAITLLAGCTHFSNEPMEATNWYALGFHDAAVGLPEAWRVNRRIVYREGTAEFDQAAYQEGFRAGVLHCRTQPQSEESRQHCHETLAKGREGGAEPSESVATR